MGGTFTTMISGSRNHFDMAVRSEAHDHGPGISNAENKPDKNQCHRRFLCHRDTHLPCHGYMNA
jgi:hypothetical protein